VALAQEAVSSSCASTIPNTPFSVPLQRLRPRSKESHVGGGVNRLCARHQRADERGRHLLQAKDITNCRSASMTK
jgi:hypothetical protein